MQWLLDKWEILVGSIVMLLGVFVSYKTKNKVKEESLEL